MQRYLVASVYRDQGDEGMPTFCDPQIVWGVTSKSACKAGRYPNSTDKEGRIWGMPTALAIVTPDGHLSYLSHYNCRLVDETYLKAIDYTKEAETGLDIMKFINAKAYFEAYRGQCRMRISYSRKMADLSWFYCQMGKISQEKHDHAYHFWVHNRLYWERKLKESVKREKTYLEGKKGRK